MITSLILKSVENFQRVHFPINTRHLVLIQTYSLHQITLRLDSERKNLVRHLIPVIKVSMGHLVEFLN